MASTTSSPSRHALALVTTNQKEVAAASSEFPRDENIEFTKEKVDALLKEQFKEKTHLYLKAKQDGVTNYIERLKTCIKWSQKSYEDLATDKDNLQAAMKKKEEDFNATICKIEADIASLNSSLANEESKKLGLQKFNTSLQQYNSKLQTYLNSASVLKSQVERKKAVILENYSTLRSHYNMLQTEFTYAKDSRDEALKQREVAEKEVGIYRGELQQVREDRERQSLLAKESASELARLRRQSSALQKTCSSKRDQISLLQYQLAEANKKQKAAFDCLKKEKEASIALEKYRKSLRKELRKANRANEQLESEKAAILQELGTLKAHNNFHDQLTKPDPFSLLQDDILLDIMSRIKCTTKELIRTTSTISRRWRNLWASVPHLIFNEKVDDNCASINIEPFFSIIDNTINLCPPYPNLKLFKLFILDDLVLNTEFKSRFNSWIRYAISRNIEEFDLQFGSYELRQFTYDDELFFSSSCITHILTCCLFNPPNGVISWGRLESLFISYGSLDEDMLEKILSGSPCLETLELNNCYGYRRINITSKSVKVFVFSRYNSNHRIYIDEDYIDCVKINAPYISSLTIEGNLVLREIALLNVSSLVEANLCYSIDWSEISQDEICRGIIESLKHVKGITFRDHVNAKKRSCYNYNKKCNRNGQNYP